MTNNYPPQTAGAHRAPKKSRKKWYIGGGIILVLAAVGISTSNGGDDAPEGTSTPAAPETAATQPLDADTATEQPAATDGHTLTFRASTSDGSTGSVTYLGPDAQITQRQDEPMPWSVDLPGIDNKWDAIGANVSVQQNGSGDVTCEVLWDGEQVATNTSSGPYSIASCSLPTDL